MTAPTRRRGAALTSLVSLAFLLLPSCGGELFCRLAVDDPDGVAGEARELVLVLDGKEASRTPFDGSYPVTQVVGREQAGKVEALVETWGQGAPLGRARATLVFTDGDVTTVTVRLGRACDADAGCDDGVFANGAETCTDGVCAAGTAPCVSAIACVDIEAHEDAELCVVTARHERCEPIVNENGETLQTYCDTAAGCLPGAACTVEGEECAQTNPCEAPPLCVSGRCVPQGAADLDDDNPCTLDLCDLAEGVVHIEDATAVGNSCLLDATSGSTGICIGGACARSRCGDGHLDRDAGEECDDGDGLLSDVDPDACRTNCALPTCGDGVTDLGEACDDQNDVSTDACIACRQATCGDGIVQTGVEECDDQNGFAQDACLPTCELNVCGDGIRDFTDEECEDGNTADFDGCSRACRFATWEVALGEPIAAGSAPIAWSIVEDDGAGGSITRKALGVVTQAGTLVALDRETGAELWRYEAASPASASPARGNHGVYMVTDDGVVHGLPLAGPAARAAWTFPLAAPSAGNGLAVSEGNTTDAVLAVDSRGRVYHINALGQDGQFTFFNTGSAASPDLRTYDPTAACERCTITAVGDLTPNAGGNEDGLPGLMVPLDGGVWAWDLFGGDGNPQRLVTETVLGQVTYRGFYDSFSGAIEEGFVYFTAKSGALFGASFSTSTGDPPLVVVNNLFTVAGTSAFVTPPLAAIDVLGGSEAIFVVDAAGAIHRYTRTGPDTDGDYAFALTPRFPVTLDAPPAASPALGAASMLFAADTAGHLHALDEVSGLELWQLDLGGVAAGSPLPSDNAVFVATTSGRVLALERGSQQAPATAWARQGRSASGNGTPARCGHDGTGAAPGPGEIAALAMLLGVGCLPRRRRSR